ncbi:MAG: 50S ribosomal protein L4 [Candidatus Nitrospinota bacterium M3_3B_026]
MKQPVVDDSNKKVGEVDLSPAVFEAKVKPHLIRDVVVWQMARRRRGTSKTKNRREARGGGQKPWRQKGLGRARAGSLRSPLFRGGGVVFGPSPRDYSYTIPKKVKKGALRSALTLKAGEGAITVVEKLAMDEPKTKKAVETLSSLGLENGKTLIVLDGRDANVELSFRNLPKVKLLQAQALNVYDLLNSDRIVFTSQALEKAQERLG